jgi:thioredoxin reductase
LFLFGSADARLNSSPAQHVGGHLLSIERIDGYPGFPDGVPGYDLCTMVQEQAAGAGAEFDAAIDAWR